MKPDYDNSILNLISSILKYYQVETKYSSLNKLDNFLVNRYDNIVLIVLDGMGNNVINENIPNGFFSNNRIDIITSVYPCTTTAAMTTYYSGKPPIETGWIAWSQYFKEYGRSIDLFSRNDSSTNENILVENKKINDIIGYETIYEKIKKNNPNIDVYEIMPDFCDKKAQETIFANDVQSIRDVIIDLCHKKKQKFILAYNDNPDCLLHKYGCRSSEVREYMKMLEENFSLMVEKLKGTNTLVIFSADHGHKDIGNTISILEDNEIQDCLIMPPGFESRMVNFFVKSDKIIEFEEIFESKFKNKFKLYSKEELLKSRLFGYGIQHKKIDDFIGDYVAIATSDTRILIENYLSVDRKNRDEKKSTHCGLTREEMEVPLIVLDIK